MSGVNKVIILGNLGRDPEVRFMPNGEAVANLTLATSESWKDKQTGEQKEKTEWHKVSLFGKLAEIAGEYLKKGSKIYIEGQLQTRKWQNQQGQDQYSTEIVVKGFNGTLQMLDGKPQGGGQQQSAPQSQRQGYQQQAPQKQQAPVQFQQQAPYNSQPGNNNQQGSYQQEAHQQQKVRPQEPVIDFNDDIPF